MSTNHDRARHQGTHRGIGALSAVFALLAACTSGDEIATAPPASGPGEQPGQLVGAELPHATLPTGSCDAELAVCGGTCVDLRSDASNCGTCGHSCGDRSCGDGICNLDAWATTIWGDYGAVTRDVARGPDGTLVVVGSFWGELGGRKSEGGTDAFVAKLTAEGELTWVERFGGEGSETASAVAIDEEGRIAVAGHFDLSIGFGATTLWSAGHDDVFVARLEPDGGTEWVRSFGDVGHDPGADFDAQPQQATSVAFDRDGHVVLAGVYAGSMIIDGAALPSQSWQDAFIVKLDDAGQSVWSKAFTAPGNVAINDVAVDDDNAIVVVGRTSDGIAIDGTTSNPADSDVLVAKLDPSGTALWTRRTGGRGNQEAVAVAIEPISNHIILAGNAAVPFFMRLEEDGRLVEGSGLPSASAQITDVDVTPTGQVWAVGILNGELDAGMGTMVSEGNDALVLLLNGEMQPVWSHRYGDADVDRATAVVGSGNHAAVVVGDFRRTFDVGGPVLVSRGMDNTFVAGLSF